MKVSHSHQKRPLPCLRASPSPPHVCTTSPQRPLRPAAAWPTAAPVRACVACGPRPPPVTSTGTGSCLSDPVAQVIIEPLDQLAILSCFVIK